MFEFVATFLISDHNLKASLPAKETNTIRLLSLMNHNLRLMIHNIFQLFFHSA
ncbi:hypothetical protein QWZ13_10315 [Reinekea marina]|uniref:hypothetical protein n=1 Tax=Reinekea marina TaxID=1310421 RepID=UPI0025B34BF5|nr:hypothetical protein [Reinekea marina]MDN3649307.1 hypothetical protein [Reinekea marina]